MVENGEKQIVKYEYASSIGLEINLNQSFSWFEKSLRHQDSESNDGQYFYFQ